jgi:methylmalonyl-CoA mutase
MRAEGASTIAIADGRLWHAAGASEAQELAAVLATLAAYLRAPGVDPAALFPRLGVAVAADTNLFPTIAKLRATRLILTRLAELMDAPSIVLPIHTETAWRTLTRMEPRMNVLRGTIATLAAIAGGADSLTVLPFDAARDPSEDGRRLSVNTQLIAAAEARLGRVGDPGAGSGAIEALTAELAATAWTEFQAIEGAGGIATAGGLRHLTTVVALARDARLARVRAGERPMVGVNVHVADQTPVVSGTSDGALLRFIALDESADAPAPAATS